MSYLKGIRAFALFACLTSFASAHVSDGITELYHEVRGGNELWVTSRSSTPVTGTHHLQVTVLRAADKAAVPDAEVSLTLMPPGGRARTYEAVPGTLTHFFEADVPLTQPGRWHLSLGVTSALGREEVAVSLRVFTPLQLGLGFAALIAALVASMALVGFGKLDVLRRLGEQSYLRRILEAVEGLGYVRIIKRDKSS